eukprot:g48924.t1
MEQGMLITISQVELVWWLLCSAMAFLACLGLICMHVGRFKEFSLVGIVRFRVCALALAAVCYTFLGFQLANGGTLGASWASYYSSSASLIFLQLPPVLLACLIVQGAVAGRSRMAADAGLALALGAFIFPVVRLLVWSPAGWLSSEYKGYRGGALFGTGMLDVAGSGVIHLAAGTVAAVSSIMVGPRIQFTGKNLETALQPAVFTIGVTLAWFGWFGLVGEHIHVQQISNALLNILLASLACGASSLAVAHLLKNTVYP